MDSVQDSHRSPFLSGIFLVGDYLSFFVAAGYHRAPLPAAACFVGHQTIVPLNS
jgi:hypothetical protein